MDGGELGAQEVCYGLLFRQGLLQALALRGMLGVAHVQRGLGVGGHALEFGLFRLQGLAGFLTRALELGLFRLKGLAGFLSRALELGFFGTQQQ